MTVTRLLLALLLASSPVAARDWFVRAGATGGDGSKEKPFADPWEPLEKCESGDAIHVAAGEYLGRLDLGMWEIGFDKVSLFGGYDATFAERNPWKHLTRLSWKPGKNRPTQPRVSSNARDVVLDGFVLDVAEQNNYGDEKRTSRGDKIGMEAIRFGQPSTVRNCVILNPGRGGVSCRAGSVIENNLIMNAIDNALDLGPGSGDSERTPAKVKKNTVLFAWDDSGPGKGGTNGSGMRIRGAADVSENLIAHCDNNAIDLNTKVERVSITKNVFFMNLWANLRVGVDTKTISIDDKTMDLLEEVGLKAFEGNAVVDPQLAFDPAWIDLYSGRTARQPGKVEMDDWNELRRTLGLPLVGTAGEGPTNFAPAYSLEKALGLLAPKNATVKAGARAIPCQVAYGASTGPTAPARTYEPSDPLTWADDPKPVNGKSLEVIVAIGNVSAIYGIPESYAKDAHAGIRLYDGTGKGKNLLGFYKKGSAVERLIEANAGRYNGQGVPDRAFKARGIAYALESHPKAAIFIESIERYEEPVGQLSPRPQGRDWFVKAGASGGDGTKEKPFKDPFQALERCEAGDTIHVAEGDYVGKLKVGRWQIDCRQVAMLGGYDAAFGERDPWKRPTRLLCPEEFKGHRSGITLEGIEDHTGFVLDGFVFDKTLNNLYQANGDLDVDRSDKTEHVFLYSPECVVRNCTFLNGSSNALTVANGMVVENNVVMNHVNYAVEVRTGFTPRSILLRGNTIVFAWNLKFGQGRGAGGSLLRLNGNSHVVAERNVLEFADNDAIKCDAQPVDVELKDNVFAHNLWSNVSHATHVVDDQSFAQLEQLGFKACSGNKVLIPGLPLDQKWFDVYMNRTAYVPGKVQMDDWNKLRDLLGQPLIATGGKPGSGFAPAYPWKLAVGLVPKNAECKAGARPTPLEVKFTGVVREEPTFEYAQTTWETTTDREAWTALDGKRVQLTVAINQRDNNYLLDDIKEADWQAVKLGAPAGQSGLPLTGYVKRGTRLERAVRLNGGDPREKPEYLWVIKGIARTNRQILIEGVEKAE